MDNTTRHLIGYGAIGLVVAGIIVRIVLGRWLHARREAKRRIGIGHEL